MLYVALGDENHWEDFSKPKPAYWGSPVSTPRGGVLFKIEDITWMASRRCTLTHWYLLDEAKTQIRATKMKTAFEVRKYDKVTLTDIGLELLDGAIDINSRPCLT